MVRGLAVWGVAMALAGSAWADELSLRRVMLSSAGIGYFEYEAAADGDVSLPLDVPLGQVDDILKSLVVFDSVGSVGAVVLPGRDAAQSAFGQVPFGPEALASPSALLNGLAGVEVSVEGPRPMRGRILRAETVTEPGSSGAPARVLTRVSLLTDSGLRQFVLEEADAVQVLDPALRERIGAAVAATRRHTARETRRMEVSSAGPAGTRTVRVSFVAAAPLWKASYRLVLPNDGEDTARLQGWATLENDTGADWSGVSLALQYGNPVTFHQAIYRSYFVERPEVPVEILGRLLPDVDGRARPVAAAARLRAVAPPPPPAPAAGAPAPMLEAPKMAVVDQAETQEATSETVFTLSKPIDLRAGSSATVPILDVPLPARRTGLARPDDPHPLDAVRIENKSGVSLPSGVLTLYDLAAAAPYAGDARLSGVPTGERRLVLYGQDLRTGLEWRHENGEPLAALTAADGTLTVRTSTRRVTHLTVSAPTAAGRHIMVEVPKAADTTVAPGFAAPVEETATAWRFAVDVAAGAVGELSYALDDHQSRTVALLEDGDDVAAAMTLQGASPAAWAALEKIQALRAQEASAAAERARLGTAKSALDADGVRLRETLKVLQPTDALRSRLLRQLDAAETRQGELSNSIEAADRAVAAAHRALAAAVSALRL